MKRLRNHLGACAVGAALVLASLPSGSAAAASRTALAPRVTTPADGSKDATFTPASLDGGVSKILVQPDGKILIKSGYGGFTGGLKRLNADGTLDDTFTSAYTSGPAITTMALQADGKILLGVNTVTDLNNYGTKGIVRLNTDGTEDTAFAAAATAVNQPTCNSSTPCSAASEIKVQIDGKILISVSRNPGPLAIRLNADGSTDGTFAIPSGTLGSPGYESMPRSYELQADGKILIGGSFSPKIKRLNSDGTVDTGFTFVNPEGFYGGLLKALPNGKILYSNGDSTIARLNYDGSADDSFTSPTLTGVGYNAPIVVQADGKILIGTSSSLVRLNADGTIDDTFTAPTATGNSQTYGLQADGKIVVTADGNPDHIIRLNNTGPTSSDGAVDTTFTPPTLDGPVNSTAIQTDGKTLIGGNFAGYLKRLNADGTVDADFAGNLPSIEGSVNAIAVQVDGKILIGLEDSITLKRLNADGTVDTDFAGNVPALDGQVNAIAVQADGKILIGGTMATRVKRLNTDGTEETSFTGNLPTFDGEGLGEIALQADGKILIGGAFAGFLKRLNSDGTEDTSFAGNLPTLDGCCVDAIAVQADGKILIGGGFTGKVKRLNYDGTNDDGFAPTVSADWVDAIAVQADGKILIGGPITGYLVRLNADGTTDASLPARPVQLAPAAYRAGRIQPSAFTPPTLSSPVFSIVVLRDGRILIGGGEGSSGILLRLGAGAGGDSGGGGGDLPPTGADTTVFVVLAVMLLAAGTVLVTTRRRVATVK